MNKQNLYRSISPEEKVITGFTYSYIDSDAETPKKVLSLLLDKNLLHEDVSQCTTLCLRKGKVKTLELRHATVNIKPTVVKEYAKTFHIANISDYRNDVLLSDDEEYVLLYRTTENAKRFLEKHINGYKIEVTGRKDLSPTFRKQMAKSLGVKAITKIYWNKE